jgi:hypothetical protein
LCGGRPHDQSSVGSKGRGLTVQSVSSANRAANRTPSRYAGSRVKARKLSPPKPSGCRGPPVNGLRGGEPQVGTSAQRHLAAREPTKRMGPGRRKFFRIWGEHHTMSTPVAPTYCRKNSVHIKKYLRGDLADPASFVEKAINFQPGAPRETSRPSGLAIARFGSLRPLSCNEILFTHRRSTSQRPT